MEGVSRTLTLTQPQLHTVVDHLSAEYRSASGITVCLKSTAIIRPDTPICYSPPNEEQVKRVLGKSMGSNLESAGKVNTNPGDAVFWYETR
jgi:hypothetical protein